MEQKIIKPYHMFNHHDNRYIINIEGMSASVIDERTAGILEHITGNRTIESHGMEIN